MLLTGARETEILTLRWENVLDSVAVFPATKNGKAHRVPLSPYAKLLLEQLPHTGDWCFANPATGKPYRDLKTPWRRVLVAAGLVGLRMHDLRRTYASWLVASGAPLTAISKLLNHSNIRVTQVYCRHSDYDLAATTEKMSDAICGVLGNRKN